MASCSLVTASRLTSSMRAPLRLASIGSTYGSLGLLK